MHSHAERFIQRNKRMGTFSIVFLGVVLSAAGGCQGLSGTALVPRLEEAKQERQILRQVKSDPFASPGDVGYQTASD